MIIFRVDFGSKIGLGHLMRSLVYIKRARFEEVVFVSRSNEKSLVPYPLITIKEEKEFFQIVKRYKPEQVVIDNYDFEYEKEKEFKRLFPDIKLSVFDDLYFKHYCDELINPNLYGKKEKYKDLVPSFCNIKIIKPLIREEFKKAKRKRFKKEGIFISLGGTDAKGIGLQILKVLKKSKPKVNFYTTSVNKHLNKIKKFAFLNKWIKLHIDENVAEGMAKSKFGIITPSTITWEAIYMELPFIAIQVADNQEHVKRYLKGKRITVIDIRREIGKIDDFISDK